MRVEKRLLSTKPPVEAVLVAETSEHEDLCRDLVAVANREPPPCQEHVAPSERSSIGTKNKRGQKSISRNETGTEARFNHIVIKTFDTVPLVASKGRSGSS
jgi:hypothetical protein